MDDRDNDNNEVRRGADLKLTFTPSKLISKLDIFEDKNQELPISKEFKIWENQPLTILNKYRSNWLSVDIVLSLIHI